MRQWGGPPRIVPCEVVDLAEAWRTLTGLPFVFALWVARKWGSISATCLPPSREGVANSGWPMPETSPGFTVPAWDSTTPLVMITSLASSRTTSVKPELAGLRRFAQMSARLGLAPEEVNLVFHRSGDLAARR